MCLNNAPSPPPNLRPQTLPKEVRIITMPRPKIDPEVKAANHKACYKRWYERLKAAGKCIKCQDKATDGLTTCAECRRINNLKYSVRYRKYAAANLKLVAATNHD